MSYCSVDELIKTTGTLISEAALQEIVEEAERDINIVLAPYDLTGSTADAPKNAALCFARAGILRRMYIDGTQPENVSASGVNAMITNLEAKGNRILADFVSDDTSGASPRVRRVHG